MNRITRWLGLIVPLLLLAIGATMLSAQADSTATGSGGGIDLIFVLKGVVAIGIPALATYLWSLVKRGVSFVDELDTIPQQIIAFLFGVLVSWLAGFAATALPSDYHLWTGDVMQNLLTGLATLGFHAIRKQK